jgi:predicted nucleotidyltransferase
MLTWPARPGLQALVVPRTASPIGRRNLQRRGGSGYLRCVSARTARVVIFAERLAADLAVILGGGLVGVYLHGSVAMACFNSDRSDVDLLVVTRQGLSPTRRRAVDELMLTRSGAPYPLEITILTADQLRPWRHPAPFDFHYSEVWRGSLEQQLPEVSWGAVR